MLIIAISKLMYGSCVCTDDNHSLKLVAYRLEHTDCEPYILNDTSNVTDSFFAIFSKLCKVFKRKFHGSEKNIRDGS